MGIYLKTKILVLLALCSLWANAKGGSKQSLRPPLDCAFYDSAITTLAQNRKIYNTLNDSIFVKQSRDEWIQNFRRRHTVFTRLYESDRKIIDAMKYDIEHYVLADSVYLNSDSTGVNYADLKSVRILIAIAKLAMNDNSDPFLAKDVAKPICDLFIRKLPNSDTALMAAYLMANSYQQILRFIDDEQLEKEFTRYCKHDIAFEYRLPELCDRAINGYVMGAYTKLIHQKTRGMGKTLYDAYHRLQALLASNDMKEFFDGNPKTKALYTTLRDAAAYSLLRNYYMVYDWNHHTAFTDSVARVDLSKRPVNSKKHPSFCNRAVTEVYLGLKTFDQAFAEASAHYEHDLTPKELIPADQLSSYTTPILNLIYLADSTSMTFEQKRVHVLKYVDALVQSVRSCKDNQANNIRNTIVIYILGYERIFKYLTSQEKEKLFHALLVYTQVQTYAHSQQVADLCKVVMNAVIDRNPRLLVGMLGTRSASDVKKNRQRFLHFITDAALYHDLGKLSMAELVKNDYRPLTHDEFAIIKQHPERGAKYLECDSALMQYHDFAMGHHKWYDGKGGYPAGYDNTRSPYRTLVDLLTICDCLEAATDRVGRNYAQKKDFATLITELEAQSGTRYNPHIVKVIATDKKVREQLSHIVDEGWLCNYYDIYKNYFKD